MAADTDVGPRITKLRSRWGRAMGRRCATGRCVVTAACLLGAALVGPGCNEDAIANPAVAGFQQPCTVELACRAPLECIGGRCAPTGSAQSGEHCVISADCVEDSVCVRGLCVEAGAGALGAPCASSVECVSGLRCGGGDAAPYRCVEGGMAYLGERCENSDECLPGLVCDPISKRCATRYSGSWGASCRRDVDCHRNDDPWLCLAEGLCGGLGPDGGVQESWSGVRCEERAASDTGFRLYFERAADDFYRLPFPNDARRGEQGIDLAGHPAPPRSTGSTLVRSLIEASERDTLGYARGFGPQQTVYMRFASPPLFCGQGCGEDRPPRIEPGCMGADEELPSVYVVDLSRDETGSFVGFDTGVPFSWQASRSDRPYICGPWIGVRPNPNEPSSSIGWKPGRTYAVFVHSRVRGCDGEVRVVSSQDVNFESALDPALPAAQRDQIWQAYLPLREWLSSSPTYPDGGTVRPEDLLGAAVFTVRDPSEAMHRVAAWSEPSNEGADSPLRIAELRECGAPECRSELFSAYLARFELPSFQVGRSPFSDGEGQIDVNADGEVLSTGREVVAISVSVPAADAPAEGWPVVVYGHGTGGDALSQFRDGISSELAGIDTDDGFARFAVVSIEQVGHGARRGSAELDPELLALSLNNPGARRGLRLQAAADQLAVARAIPLLSAELEAVAGSSDVSLDAERIAWFGHSQGGEAQVLAVATLTGEASMVLSGVGGALMERWSEKSQPYSSSRVLRSALVDATMDDVRFHPVVSLLQGYLEEVDPLAFAGSLTRGSRAIGGEKHVLLVVGEGDRVTPNASSLALARGLGGPYLDLDGTGLPPGQGAVVGASELPLSETVGDRAVVTSIHAEAPDRDPHLVVFDNQRLASERAARFLAGWVLRGQPKVCR